MNAGHFRQAPAALAEALRPFDDRLKQVVEEAVAFARENAANWHETPDDAANWAARLMATRAAMLVVMEVLGDPKSDLLISTTMALRDLHEAALFNLRRLIEETFSEGAK